MSASALPTGSPASQGVDASGVHAFLDALEAAPEIEPHSLMIMRHGHLVASGWWAPYSPDRPHLLYSLSKSFTGTAAALAEVEGLLDFDAPVISYFPEFEADITDPRSRAILVRHVASMSSGHERETVEETYGLDPMEPVRGFLLLPPDRDPGTVFAYNQPATYTLAAIVQRVTGQSLTDYLRPRLLDPLGIGEVFWQRDRGKPRDRLQRSARHHRRGRPARRAVSARRGLGGRAAAARRVGGPGNASAHPDHRCHGRQ